MPWAASILALVGLALGWRRKGSSAVSILSIFLLASNALACLKTVSNTDRYMFHLAYVPALFVLAAAGYAALARRWEGSRRQVAGLAVGLLVVANPVGWRGAATAYQDQTAFQSMRQLLRRVPRGCRVLYPGPFPLPGVSDRPPRDDRHPGIPDQVYRTPLEMLGFRLGLTSSRRARPAPRGRPALAAPTT